MGNKPDPKSHRKNFAGEVAFRTPTGLARLGTTLCLEIFLALSLEAQDLPLTNCAAVRGLTREAAASQLPVTVQGVVTFSYPRSTNSFVMQDDTVGVYVGSPDVTEPGLPRPNWSGLTNLEPGMRVEVNGVSGPGRFAPIITLQSIRFLGRAPLPVAPLVSVAALRAGTYDCQPVEIEAVVRRCEPEVGSMASLRMDMASLDGHLVAYVARLEDYPIEQFVDAQVRMRGVCFAYYNQRGEMVGSRLEVNSTKDIHIQKKGGLDPFAVSEVQLGEVLPFSSTPTSLHRQRLSGVVTLCRPGAFFYVQNGNHAIRVNTTQSGVLKPGDRVEASGFLEILSCFVEMSDAVFRKVGEAPVPSAIEVTRDQILENVYSGRISGGKNDFDGRLVSVRGRLEKIEANKGEEPRLSLDFDGHTFTATLGSEYSGKALESILPGSDVQVTGVCVVQLAASWPAHDMPLPTGFRLLLRTPGDVHVLKAPPWWSAKRLGTALGVTGIVLAASLAWAVLLRRRVEQRTVELAHEMQARHNDELEFQAVLRERGRMAADLHDTLEQSLTGAALQLQATELAMSAQPERAPQHLGLARQILESSRDEVRRSVWDLRARSLENRDLMEAFQEIARQLTSSAATHIEVKAEGTPHPLKDLLANNLFHAGQEAMTNALKHGRANRIDVILRFSTNKIELVVRDNGVGFDSAKAPGPDEGHFGLQGMRERARRLDGVFRVESQPGRGTTVCVTVPIPGGI